jgi:hypothetical protein
MHVSATQAERFGGTPLAPSAAVQAIHGGNGYEPGVETRRECILMHARPTHVGRVQGWIGRRVREGSPLGLVIPIDLPHLQEEGDDDEQNGAER